MENRILIIKLGALGDVLRTTPILPILRNVYPAAHITWVTEPEALALLRSNPAINRLLPLDFRAWAVLSAEEFALMLSLDKDAAGAALATVVKAKIKRGFGWGPQGAVCALDEKADYAYRLGIDNELKFRTNQKTYQQITAEMCDLTYNGEEYQWELTPDDVQYAKWWAKGTGLDRRHPTIGLNTGWGEKFAGKGWSEENWSAFIEVLQGYDANIVLLGGPRETELNSGLFRRHRGRGSLHNSGTNNSTGQFGGIVDLCDLVVSGDTFGMHVAIARKKKLVVLFGSTCPQEIDLYGRGIKVYSTDLPCSPCYKKECDQPVKEECLKRISVEKVAASVQELLPLTVLRREQSSGRGGSKEAVQTAEDAGLQTASAAPNAGAHNGASHSNGHGGGRYRGGRHDRDRGRDRWRRHRGR